MKNRPKKTNPRARKPSSRYEKVECPFCDTLFSKPSLAGHIAVTHQSHIQERELVTHEHQHEGDHQA